MMNHDHSPINDRRCPLCGSINQCGVHTGDCWCFHTKVPAELRARIPEPLRGKACICQKCVEAYKAELHQD